MNTYIHTRMNEHTYRYSQLHIPVTQYKIKTQQNKTVVEPPPHITLWQKVETKLSYSGRLFA